MRLDEVTGPDDTFLMAGFTWPNMGAFTHPLVFHIVCHDEDIDGVDTVWLTPAL